MRSWIKSKYSIWGWGWKNQGHSLSKRHARPTSKFAKYWERLVGEKLRQWRQKSFAGRTNPLKSKSKKSKTPKAKCTALNDPLFTWSGTSRDQAGERSFEFGVKLTLLGKWLPFGRRPLQNHKVKFQRLAGVIPRGTTANITVIDEIGDDGPIMLKIVRESTYWI